MAMNRHEEENIMIGDWRHASLIPPLTADEDAASNDGADSKNHPAVYRMIQNEKLDRNLKRHQITGIALSGTIGIGLFINSGELLGLSGSVGIILSYFFGGLIAMAVMMCLAEMVSVRPVPGAIFEYPMLYVDPALGYAVGFAYWLAYSMSLATLTVSAAILTKYWTDFRLPLASVIVILITGIACSNVFGVRLYGNLEWGFKWMKILLIVGLDILMIAINCGVGQKGAYIGGKNFTPNLQFPSGYSSSHLNATTSPVDIPGPTGQFLGVWTSISLVGYGFIGVELVVVTAGEAKYPRRDLPKASRRTYLLTILLYLFSAILIAFNVPFTNPNLLPPSNTDIDKVTGDASPYIIAIKAAGLGNFLPSFVNACFLLAAWTAANTALYVSSRTLYALARSSDVRWFKKTVGRTSSEGTPLIAIGLSFMFAFLAFLAPANTTNGSDIVTICTNISTNSILCVYIAECIAFLRFMKGMKHTRSINRDDAGYKKYFYRSPRQPLPAYFAIIFCSCIVFFSGWETFYELSHNAISSQDAAVSLISHYIGPILFLAFYLAYKLIKNTHMTSYANFGTSYTPIEAGLDDEPEESSNAFIRFLSWIR